MLSDNTLWRVSFPKDGDDHFALKRNVLQRVGYSPAFDRVKILKDTNFALLRPGRSMLPMAVVFLILGVFCRASLSTQSFDQLFKLYEQREYSALRELVEQVNDQYPEAPEVLFFQAIFIEDGQKAKDQYIQVFENGGVAIKILAAKKLMDYFYAKGYYEQASQYQKYLAENERIAGVENGSPEKQGREQQKEISKEQYYIQVGAFGMRENARQRCDMLATQHIRSEIVVRSIGGKNLFCVCIAGAASFEETLKYANTLKSKYDLDFRIIKK